MTQEEPTEQATAGPPPSGSTETQPLAPSQLDKNSPDTSQYRSLRTSEIVATLKRLQERILDRFPKAGLANVCHEMLQVADDLSDTVDFIARPVYWLRGSAWVLAVVILFVFAEIALNAKFNPDRWGGKEIVELLDAGFNVVILVGAAIFFLFSMETRYKRKRALAAIHELRSIAHIIDMHQLTKDPERVLSKEYFQSNVSPKLSMTQFELRRYLDYCNEMLSLAGKIAAVYIESFDDPAAISAASEFEILASGLSRKIWQKILILHTFEEGNQPRRTIIVDR